LDILSQYEKICDAEVKNGQNKGVYGEAKVMFLRQFFKKPKNHPLYSTIKKQCKTLTNFAFPKVFLVLSLTPVTKLTRLDSETDWTLLAPETAHVSYQKYLWQLIVKGRIAP